MEAGRSLLNTTHWMNLTAFSGKLTSRLTNFPYSFGKMKDFIQKRPRFLLRLALFFISFFIVLVSAGQKVRHSTYEDSLSAAKVDSLIKAQHSPRKAAIRSAIIPGWGQIYNRKYWKVPIVWGALGVTGYIFFNNLYTYQDLKFSYAAKYKASVPPYDSTDYFNIKDQYAPISPESLRAGRDHFRRYVYYTAVFFLVFWGLNVVDAAVDAHLKAFDISPDLTMKIKPAYNPLAKTGGVILVFNFKH